MIKVGVIGNCQGISFIQCIRSLIDDVDIKYVHYRELGKLSEEGKAAKADVMAGLDVVFHQTPHDDRLGPLSPDQMAGRVHVISYPGINFRGFHPDCGYVSSEGRDVPSPTGVYHSIFALACYQSGLSVKRTVRLFNNFTYSSLDYLDEYEAGRERMRERLAKIGYASEAFDDKVFMHTVNHPTVNVSHEIAKQALEKAGIAFQDAPPPEDGLAKAEIWPVYPGLQGAGEFVFKGAVKDGERTQVGLEEFIDRSFEIYARYKAPLRNSLAGRARQYIASNVI